MNFNLKGLSLDRLEGFLRVAEAGSLAEAARREALQLAPGDSVEQKRIINKRQVQYCRQIADLERIFGDLIDKTGRQHTLNDRGRELMGVVRLFSNGIESLQAEAGVSANPVRIGSNNTNLGWLVAPLLPLILETLPGFRVFLVDDSSSKLVARIREGSLDLALIRRNALPAEPGKNKTGNPFKWSQVARFGYSLFVPSREPLATRDLDALLNLNPVATLAVEGEFVRALRDHRVPVDWQVGCSSFGQAKALLDTGKYSAILPETAGLACIHPPVGGVVIRVELPMLRPFRRELVLAWNKRSLESRRIEEAQAHKIAGILRDGAKPLAAGS